MADEPQDTGTERQKKKKIPEGVSAEEFDRAYNPPKGLTVDEAATKLDEASEEVRTTLEGYEIPDPDSFEGDGDALRESLERLRDEGTVKSATDALERLDDFGELQSREGDGPAGDPIPFDSIAERLGVSADDVLVTRKVQGEEEVIPLSEALADHLKHADYSKKTAELAENRRAIQEEREQLADLSQQAAQRLELLDGVFRQSLTPQQRQQVAQAYQRVLSERQALEARNLATRIPQEHEALKEKLGWESEEDVQQGKERLAEAAISMGFDAEDLSNVHDHRLLVLLDRAARYEELTARTEDAKAEAQGKRRETSKTLRPGVGGSQKPSKLSGVQRSLQSLRRTGRVSDAVDALDSLLPDDL